MDRTRRDFLQGAAFLSAGVLGTHSLATAQNNSGDEKMRMPNGLQMHNGKMQMPNGPPPRMSSEDAGFLPVITPDRPCVPFWLENGVKVFRLIAEPIRQEITPGKIVNLRGYNGSASGPTNQAK